MTKIATQAPEGVELQLPTGDWIAAVRVSYAGTTGYDVHSWVAEFPRGTLKAKPLGMRMKAFPAQTRVEICEESATDAFLDNLARTAGLHRLLDWLESWLSRGKR